MGGALQHLPGSHVDADQVVLHAQIDDVRVLGVDEHHRGALLGQPRGLEAVVGPELREAHPEVERPLGRVRFRLRQRPHGERLRATLVGAGDLDAAELAIAEVDGAADATLWLVATAARTAASAASREQDEDHVGVGGEGVAAQEARLGVDPPEFAVVREDLAEGSDPAGHGVGDVLGDPLGGVRREAEERGLVVADGVLELGEHVATAAAGRGNDADVAVVADALLGVVDAGGGGGGHVEDEEPGPAVAENASAVVVGEEAAPRRRVVGGGRRRLEEEEAGGSVERTQGPAGLACRSISAEETRDDALGDDEAGHARRRGEVEGEVGNAVLDARHGAEDDPGLSIGRRRRHWIGTEETEAFFGLPCRCVALQAFQLCVQLRCTACRVVLQQTERRKWKETLRPRKRVEFLWQLAELNHIFERLKD